jgi:hypothetical protein
VGVNFQTGCRRGHVVGYDEMKAPRSECLQRGRRILLQDLQRPRVHHVEGRGEQVVHESLGQTRYHPDTQDFSPRAHAASCDVVQLPSQPKDVLGITGCVYTKGGEYQTPATSLEQRGSEVLFEHPELGAEGRMGQSQLSCGRSQSTFPRDYREVEEVMVVEPIHSRMSQ